MEKQVTYYFTNFDSQKYDYKITVDDWQVCQNIDFEIEEIEQELFTSWVGRIDNILDFIAVEAYNSEDAEFNKCLHSCKKELYNILTKYSPLVNVVVNYYPTENEVECFILTKVVEKQQEVVPADED